MPRRNRRNRKTRMPRVHTSQNLLKTSAFRSAVKATVGKTAETYHHRVDQTATSVSELGILTELNTVDSQGVQSGQIRGQEIRQIALNLRGEIVQSDNSNIVRMCVFRPTAKGQEIINGGATFSDLFYNPARAIYSSWLPGTIEKMYVDRTYVLNQAQAQNDEVKLLKMNQRLGGMKYKLVEADLGQANPAGGAVIYAGFVSDSAFATHPQVEFESVLYYHDF